MNYVELIIIALFVFAFYYAYLIKKVDLLIYSTLFALIFENLNVILFNSTHSGYFYSNEFILIFKTPLFVILSWGIIILSSYIISEHLTKNKIKRILLVPLLAVMIDFAFEASAVANNLWVWNLSSYNGFLFIPAENFIGWILVSLAFMISYNYLNKEIKFLSIFTSYILFILLSIITFSLSQIFKLNNLGNFIILFIIVSSFLIFIFYKQKNEKIKLKEIYNIIILRLPFYIYPLLYFNKWSYDLVALIIYFLMLIIEISLYIYLVHVVSINNIKKRK